MSMKFTEQAFDEKTEKVPELKLGEKAVFSLSIDQTKIENDGLQGIKIDMKMDGRLTDEGMASLAIFLTKGEWGIMFKRAYMQALFLELEESKHRIANAMSEKPNHTTH